MNANFRAYRSSKSLVSLVSSLCTPTCRGGRGDPSNGALNIFPHPDSYRGQILRPLIFAEFIVIGFDRNLRRSAVLKSAQICGKTLTAEGSFFLRSRNLTLPARVFYRKLAPLKSTGMLKTYLNVALRALWKNKISSTINILGLAVGLTSCLLIALYVQHQFSYDAFQPNGKRIARVIMSYAFDGSPESKEGDFTSTKVAPVFSSTFPEVLKGVRMTNYERLVELNHELITEPNFLYTDSSFFDVFQYKMLEGDPATALNGPNKLVLTRSTAHKYFGTKSPLGQTIYAGAERLPFEVTGVVEDYPSNSQMKFDFLASFSSLGANQVESYWDANYKTFLLLQDENKFAPLQAKVDPFMIKEMKGSGASIKLRFEPYDRIHLYSPYDSLVPNVDITYLYILMAVAVLILVIVCFTYINLSTARSVERAREIGIRKVVGAARSQVFWQFIGESAAICFIAVIFSVLFTTLALPWFNELTGEYLLSKDIFNPAFVLFIVGATSMVSLLAGAYPAMVLSGFQPAKVLKGVFKNSSSGKSVQQALIVFQFAIAVFLIAATVIIQNQLHYIQNKKLGYDRDHVVVLPFYKTLREKAVQVKEQIERNPDVINVAAASWTPVHIGSGYNMRSSTMLPESQISVAGNPVDEEYLPATGLQLVAGENFTEQDLKEVSVDEKPQFHFILNETAARQLGWTPEEAIGKEMFMGDQRPGRVRGVVKDFHFESLHQPIKALVLFTQREGRILLVKIKGNDVPGTMAALEKQWKELAPTMPFDYKFMDESYNQLYHSELQLGSIMNLFAAIAIILACVGLFGLSIDIVQQRMKEIGIRKVLGASGWNILSLISGKFTRLVGISIVIASPIAWFTLDKWLESFVYRIQMSWWMFGIAGAAAIFIALLTISFQGFKAMTMNPADSLKVE
jgi:putative ABC transport system permease protein